MTTANGRAFLASGLNKQDPEDREKILAEVLEKRKTYIKFSQTWTGTDLNCKHPHIFSIKLGRCYYEYFCDDCKCIFTIDSSD